ncbi:MAG: Ig-like domain-containing protein [Candidatus Cloacimonetes bacterium]|nr:Ig-like domain-containing protein [Candidatus Cloacimonadota bacterium]
MMSLLIILAGCTSSTSPDVQTTAPIVISTFPADHATDVPINIAVIADFSEEIDAQSITAATFSCKQGTIDVPGTVTNTANAAMFTPTGNLQSNSTFTVLLTTGIKDLDGNNLNSDYSWSFATGETIDTAPPTIIVTYPADQATNVTTGSSITARFSDAIDPVSLTSATFFLAHGNIIVPGTITHNETIAIFNPEENLMINTIYTVTITTGIQDIAGNSLEEDYVWSFTTSASDDNEPPIVISTVPLDQAADVALNSHVTVIFSEHMNPLSITPETFTLLHGTTQISGAVTYMANTAIFIPSVNLLNNTAYMATLTTGIQDISGNNLEENYTWDFDTGSVLDIIPPVVINTYPVFMATDVPINSQITATFSEAMDPLTITPATFTLLLNNMLVSGAVTFTANTAIFTPSAILFNNHTYTGRLSTGIRDLAGNAMVHIYGWSFTTSGGSDIIPPEVISTFPADEATNIAINSQVTAVFSEAMNPLSINSITFTLKRGATHIAGSVNLTTDTAIFSPTLNLESDTEYNATIASEVHDLAGNVMLNDYNWSFITSTIPDITPPSVISTFPADEATDVALNCHLTAIFSEIMDPLSITPVTFILLQGTTPVTGSITHTASTSVFTPDANLSASSVYTARITTGVIDLAGNAMTEDYVWIFTTGTQGAIPAPVDLGTSGNFVILAKSAVSTIPNSIITGDVGLSPAATSYLTGFALTDWTGHATSDQVTGFIYASDMADPTPIILTTAILNMETAYTDAATRPNPGYINLSGGNIGGLALAPGLYHWGSTVTISADVTLSGGADAVWIFQISSDLVSSTGTGIILSGGALAQNVFWQVAGQVTLGADSHFEGIILSQTSITLATNASINGRTLAQTMVALDQVTLTEPAQ